MSTRRGLGKGLGALIPSATGKPPASEARPAVTHHDPASEDAAEPTEAPAYDQNGQHRQHSQHGQHGQHAGEVRHEGRREGQDHQALHGENGQRDLREEQPPQPAEGDPAAVQGASLVEVPVGEIRTNPRQPRQVFEEDALAELTHSIKEVGLLQPVVVRRQPDGDGYLLIMGERRLRAAKDAELAAIPAIVRDTNDEALLRDALLENLHRVQLNPLEEAAAYGQLLEDFGCTHEDLADRIGRSRPQITNTIRLLKLPPSIQRRVAAGVLSAGHARALLMVSDEARQEHLAHRIVAEGISVRALEELVALDDTSEKKQQRKAAGPKPVAPKVVDLQDRLSDRFETRVKVDLGRSKGKITVEFASVDDLERIVDLMDPKRQ